MTAITTIAIILALFLGGYCNSHAQTLCHITSALKGQEPQRKNTGLSWLRANDCFALYSVKRIDNVECRYHGYWAVCRSSICEGGLYQTCIKVFTDEDDDFNKREAEELSEMLNSK